MRILHISDTHSRHRLLTDLPAADIIVHSGDISWAGKPEEVMDFINWFCGLNYRYKIFIAGNHDYCLDSKKPDAIQRHLPENCFYLYDSAVTIEGLKFWGAPFFISDELRGNFKEIAELIPPDTDVLVTHRPPFGILDRAGNINFGCPELLAAVMKISLRYHLFGHVHDAYGMKKEVGITFVNGALLDGNYSLVNEPVVIEI